MNGELKMVTEYLKISRYSSGKTETTTGIADFPDEVQAI
jgi:hypothetical protein